MTEKEKLIKAIERKENELAKLQEQYRLARMRLSRKDIAPAGECRVRQAMPDELAAIEKAVKGAKGHG